MGTWTSKLRFEDRWNPVLVREVRQALRGRMFRVAFLLTITAALVVVLFCISRALASSVSPSELGRAVFEALLVFILLTVLLQVPFGAYMAVSAEWEEDTFDLMALSNLRPQQIVRGKMLSAALQALLYYSALAPLIVFCFLLQGVGWLPIAVVLGGTLLVSGAYTAFAIALASLARNRFLRGALAGLLMTACVGTTMAMFEGMGMDRWLVGGSVVRGRELAAVIGFVLTASTAVIGIATSAAAARLAHPEENRSTSLRVFVAIGALLLLAWMQGLLIVEGYHWEIPAVGCMAAITLLALGATLFATEADGLGRRVRLQVPRGGARALLAAPWLPGGSFGMLWFALGSALCIAWALMNLALYSGAGLGLLAQQWDGLVRGLGASFGAEQDFHDATGGRTPPYVLLELVVWLAYGLLFLGLPALLVRRYSRRLRWATALAPFGFFLLCIGAPACVGLITGNKGLQNGEYASNPVLVVVGIVDGEPWAMRCSAYVLACGLLALLAGLRPLRLQLAELRAASRAAALRGSEPAPESGAVDAHTAS